MLAKKYGHKEDVLLPYLQCTLSDLLDIRVHVSDNTVSLYQRCPLNTLQSQILVIQKATVRAVNNCTCVGMSLCCLRTSIQL